MLIRALLQTSPLWEPIRLVYSWVHRAAHVLSNEEDLRVEQLRRDYRHLLAEMSRRKEQAGDLSGAVSLFLKVTKSYWKGLFRCYSFPEGTLPHTNNDLEHYFGSVRYGERRASGRKGASPAMVLRGSVRAIAAIATPQEGFAAADIRPTNVEGWRSLRASLEKRRESRRAQLRFRPSYASGGTQMPISVGSKSSYSAGFAVLEKKAARPTDGNRCHGSRVGHGFPGRVLVEPGGFAHPQQLLRERRAPAPRPAVGRQRRPRAESRLLLWTLPARDRRHLAALRGRQARKLHNHPVPRMVPAKARRGGQEGSSSDLGQRQLARLQRGQAMARKTQPPSERERTRSEGPELSSAQAESVAERHRAQMGSWQAQSCRARRSARSLRTCRQSMPGFRLSSLRASVHSPGGRLIMH